MIRLAEWDTRHFGIKIGNLLPDEPFETAKLIDEIALSKRQGYDLLYLKGRELPEAMLGENVLLADIKVVYEHKRLDVFPIGVNTHVASILHHDMDDELLELALESGRYSRFNTDHHFPPQVFRSLYATWMKKSLNGELASDVLVYMSDKHPMGFITWKIQGKKATIGLVAVRRDSARTGIGSILMLEMMRRCRQTDSVEVATQEHNHAACRFYEKNGFTIKSKTKIYHIWNYGNSIQ